MEKIKQPKTLQSSRNRTLHKQVEFDRPGER